MVCLDSCPSGTEEDEETHECKSVEPVCEDPHCLLCPENPGDCQECQDGYGVVLGEEGFGSCRESGGGGLSTGAIAGTVIGVVAAASVTAFLVWLLRFRGEAEGKREEGAEENGEEKREDAVVLGVSKIPEGAGDAGDRVDTGSRRSRGSMGNTRSRRRSTHVELRVMQRLEPLEPLSIPALAE